MKYRQIHLNSHKKVTQIVTRRKVTQKRVTNVSQKVS